MKDDNKYWQIDANLVWDINEDLRFTSITGYSDLYHDALSDGPLIGFNVQQDFVGSESIYQEFQLNATLFDGKVDLVTGLNYFHEESNSHGVNLQRRGTSTYSAQGGTAGTNADGGLWLTRTQQTDQESDSYGWFNNVTWHMTDKMNLTAGVRFAHDEKEIDIVKYPGIPSTDFIPVPGTSFTAVTADDSWDAVDWRGTYDYHFTQDIMAYATVSKAHKAGAYQYTIASCTAAACLNGAQQSAQIKALAPEEVVNYEAGARLTLFDGRLRFNPTAYMMEWTNRQTAVRVACAVGPECPQGSQLVLRNTGNIDLYGVEVDIQFAATDNLIFDAAFGSTRADILDPVANGGTNLFPPQASPTYNVGATYNLRDTSIGNFVFNLNYAYTDEQETYPESSLNASSDSAYLLESYEVVNTRLQWTSPGKSNVITLFVNNLLDEDYATFGTKFGGGYWDSFSPTGAAAAPRNMVSVTAARPREIGITLQHNFK